MHDRLFRLLQLIDYSKDYAFRSIRAELEPVIKDALKQVNVNVGTTDLLLHYLPKEEALKFDVQWVNINIERKNHIFKLEIKKQSRPPQGIELRPLTEFHDLQKVNSLWSHRNSNTLSFFQRISKYSPNVGAFTEDGTLVAWVLR